MKNMTLVAEPEAGYALLDSGQEEKLERWGAYTLLRPDPGALWKKRLPEGAWRAADAWYERRGKEGKWHVKESVPKEWPIAYGGLKFLIRTTSFKHTGLFPEQEPNWRWISETLKAATRKREAPQVLNLFAYTGGATLSAASSGAEVVHLDASQTAVLWAKENAAASNLSGKPIRWLVEDALVFVKKELKRGRRYDGVIMDPPAFGHGPKNELWKIEEHFLPLMEACASILSDRPLFFLVNGYAAGYSPLAFARNLAPLSARFGGEVEYGELTIRENEAAGERGKTGQLLPAGMFARIAFPPRR